MPRQTGGRHASAPTSRFSPVWAAIAALAVVALVAGGIAVASLVGGGADADDSAATGSGAACVEPVTITVASAPEVTPAIQLAAESASDECTSFEITATPARDGAAAIEAGRVPDVWVPDAPDWTSRITEHRSGDSAFTLADLAPPAEEPPAEQTDAGWTSLGSVATTPVVLAVGADPSAGNEVTPEMTWRDMFTTSVAIQMAQPSTNAASRLALDTARGAVPAETDDYVDLGQRMIFLSRFAAESDTAALSSEDPATGDVVPFPVSEQRLAAYVEGNPSSGLRPVIPAGGTPELTYPMYARAAAPADVTSAAERLYEATQSEEVLAALSEAGFRTSAAPGPTVNEVPADAYEAAVLPEPERAIATTRLWDTLRLDMRMLAAIDVSGSMRWEAGDSTRVELTQRSTQDALAILPDGSQIGAWGFSTDRGPGGEDFFEITPIRGLETRVEDRTQRQVLSDEVAGLDELLGGDTGLYDTALAAFRAVQEGYDPAYVNSVVLLTDGENDDSTGGLELDELLAELEAAADPQRPVRIVAIGIGPDTDPSALQAIAEATGGTSYVATQPSDIETVFFRALLARAA
ncbi:MAG: substrate-binding domain-containing protein [Dermatophilaceae bacterium]